jgi:hypothetical protein
MSVMEKLTKVVTPREVRYHQMVTQKVTSSFRNLLRFYCQQTSGVHTPRWDIQTWPVGLIPLSLHGRDCGLGGAPLKEWPYFSKEIVLNSTKRRKDEMEGCREGNIYALKTDHAPLMNLQKRKFTGGCSSNALFPYAGGFQLELGLAHQLF